MDKLVKKRIMESIELKNKIVESKELIDRIVLISRKLVDCINNSGKIIICGNGGSASDSLHMAGEIIGRFQMDRGAWPIICLNSDVAVMTAIANDYGYDKIFSRQVEAHIRENDILIGISTSGNSKNVYEAIVSAKNKGNFTIALLGNDGGIISNLTDVSLIIPNNITARIQEMHILIIHIICELVEIELNKDERRNEK